MPREDTLERKESETWTWATTNETQIRLLDAGAKVFREEGYRNASVAQIVAEAGSSTGSLYHHFGGKSELFIALWQEHYSSRNDEVRMAVRLARAGGERDPLELFLVGTRSYVMSTWERRDIGRIFLGFDGPPAFEEARSESSTEWIRRNNIMLGLEGKVEQRITVGVLTSIIGEAAREVAVCTTKRQAVEVASTTEAMVRRVWPPYAR